MKKHSRYLSLIDATNVDGVVGRTPDFPKPGVLFLDVLPLLNDAPLFSTVVWALCGPYRARGEGPDKIVGLEARGFLMDQHPKTPTINSLLSY